MPTNEGKAMFQFPIRRRREIRWSVPVGAEGQYKTPRVVTDHHCQAGDILNHVRYIATRAKARLENDQPKAERLQSIEQAYRVGLANGAADVLTQIIRAAQGAEETCDHDSDGHVPWCVRCGDWLPEDLASRLSPAPSTCPECGNLALRCTCASTPTNRYRPSG